MCNENLARICEEKEIHQFNNLNPSTHKIGKRTKADKIEAKFAAVVQDGDMESLKRVLNLLGLFLATAED